MNPPQPRRSWAIGREDDCNQAPWRGLYSAPSHKDLSAMCAHLNATATIQFCNVELRDGITTPPRRNPKKMCAREMTRNRRSHVNPGMPVNPWTETVTHHHRDFRCPDCGALVTCLSCVEVQAGCVPHGPAFTQAQIDPLPSPSRQFEPSGVAGAEITTGPDISTLGLPLPVSSIHQQQSLFAQN